MMHECTNVAGALIALRLLVPTRPAFERLVGRGNGGLSAIGGRLGSSAIGRYTAMQGRQEITQDGSHTVRARARDSVTDMSCLPCMLQHSDTRRLHGPR